MGKGSAETELTALVLDGVTSDHSRRAYGKGLALFFAWVKERPPQAFAKALVQEYRAWLLAQGLAPATVNLRLSPLRKLAREMADNGLLSAELATCIGRTKGIKQQGVRAGNWLLREQASTLLNAPDPSTLKGKRDRAMLALLVGCGLRRGELLALEVDRIQQREGRWVIPDLCGEGQPPAHRPRACPGEGPHRRLAEAAAAIKEGRIFRPVNKGGRITGESIADEKAVWQMVLKYAREKALGKLSPHDLRRTCAKLCRKAGGDLEQIQLLLGHASIQTTERYLGTDQNLATAVNDALGLNLG